MKKKKKKRGSELSKKDRQAEIITIVVIALFTLLGIFLGYQMFKDLSTAEPHQQEQTPVNQ